MKNSKTRWFLLVGLILLVVGLIFASRIYAPNIASEGSAKKYLFVRTGSNFDLLVKNLDKNKLLTSTDNFVWAARFYHFGQVIKPGKYRLTSGMSNKEIIRMLKLGNQEPVDIILHGLRRKEDLAGFVGHRLEADSSTLSGLLNNAAFAERLGYTIENIYTLVLPNTYRFKWNTSASDFFERMRRESKKFWNNERTAKAAALKLTKSEVLILASIVNQESNKVDEMPLIAGVYLNRLRRGIKLDADPTVIFANNDFLIKRVTRRYLQKISPYNTYLNKGLPPGPITMPSLSAIESVLNYRKSDYLFFCAREDFSGYHAFAVTKEEHLKNARRFQQALDARNIF